VITIAFHLRLTAQVGYRVAQIRMIFSLQAAAKSTELHQKLLAYVQWFSKPQRQAEGGINMYRVERVMAGRHPKGDIIALDSVWRPVQLIPHFGQRVMGEERLNMFTSMEICRYFYINSFADKETYQAIY